MRDDLLLIMDSTASITFTPMGDVYLVINPGHTARTVPPGGTLVEPAAKTVAPVAGT